jgi:hypothetical protein
MGQIRLTSNKLSSRQKKCCTLTAAMLFLATSPAFAGWRVVYDPWTTGQVGANTTAQKLIENKHNERLDTISEKQKKILQYTATMEGIKELYHLTMTNVRGFGEETAYYKEIFLLSADILSGIPTVTKYIASNPVKNYVLCLNELADIVIETEGLIHDFIDVVNNGKIKLPDNPIIRQKIPNGGGRYNMGQGDGYNFMDRYTRLTLANKIYSRLLEMKYKMDVMVMMCQFGTWGEVFFAIDPESWASVYQASSMVDGIIRDWNGIGI